MELISREEAKRKITEELDSIDHVPHWVYERLSTAIESIPTIEEWIESEWINDIRYSGWTCKHCNYHDGNRTDKYCPNCGARMKGE